MISIENCGDSVITYAHIILLLREMRGDTEPWPNQMTTIMILDRCGSPSLCSTKVFIKSKNILQVSFNPSIFLDYLRPSASFLAQVQGGAEQEIFLHT